MMWVLTSRLKHFMMIDVSATGRWSCKLGAFVFYWGTGIMVFILKHVGTTD